MDGSENRVSVTGLSDLRRYLDLLRREDRVVEITAEVDPRFEAAEIHRRVVAAGGPTARLTRPSILPGPGRTYRVTYRATDAVGNVSRGTSRVLVPAIPQRASGWTRRGTPGAQDNPGGKPSSSPRPLEQR